MAKRVRKTQKPARAFGRSLSDFPNLTPAEKKLLDHCRRGKVLWLANERPEKGKPDNTIRPGLIRFLLLGGDEQNPVHEEGVQVRGAWIAAVEEGDADSLDLENASAEHGLLLWDCNLRAPINLLGARLPALNLTGSQFPGLSGDGFHCASDINLRNVTCVDEVRLLGADIGGNMDCSGGHFRKPDGNALICDRAQVKGSVFLNVGFKAEGEVRLLGADIGGNLTCQGGHFSKPDGDALSCDGVKVRGNVFLSEGFRAEGEVRFLGADIGGDLYCQGGHFSKPDGNALSCDLAKVKGAFFLRGIRQLEGGLDFSGMAVGRLVDDQALLGRVRRLDGFTYGSLDGGALTSAAHRIAWLKRQPTDHLSTDFRPQPWEHCIKVLREMGHDADARAVAVEKQRMLYDADKVGGFPRQQLHWLYGRLAGYGYLPLRTIAYLLLIWFFCAGWFASAANFGIMAPASPIIHADPAITTTCSRPIANVETRWMRCVALPKEYTTFNALTYSLDLILPLVDLGQERDWAPLSTGPRSQFTRFLMWFEILFGWAASLLLVAVLGNLVKKD